MDNKKILKEMVLKQGVQNISQLVQNYITAHKNHINEEYKDSLKTDKVKNQKEKNQVLFDACSKGENENVFIAIENGGKHMTTKESSTMVEALKNCSVEVNQKLFEMKKTNERFFKTKYRDAMDYIVMGDNVDMYAYIYNKYAAPDFTSTYNPLAQEPPSHTIDYKTGNYFWDAFDRFFHVESNKLIDEKTMTPVKCLAYFINQIDLKSPKIKTFADTKMVYSDSPNMLRSLLKNNFFKEAEIFLDAVNKHTYGEELKKLLLGAVVSRGYTDVYALLLSKGFVQNEVIVMGDFFSNGWQNKHTDINNKENTVNLVRLTKYLSVDERNRNENLNKIRMAKSNTQDNLNVALYTVPLSLVAYNSKDPIFIENCFQSETLRNEILAYNGKPGFGYILNYRVTSSVKNFIECYDAKKMHFNVSDMRDNQGNNILHVIAYHYVSDKGYRDKVPDGYKTIMIELFKRENDLFLEKNKNNESVMDIMKKSAFSISNDGESFIAEMERMVLKKALKEDRVMIDKKLKTTHKNRI